MRRVALIGVFAVLALPAPAWAAADLSVMVADSKDPAATGQEIIYSATVAHEGGEPAAGAKLTVTLGSGLTFQGADECTVSGQVVTCDLGTLPSGGGATRFIKATSVAAGTRTVTATVGATPADNAPENNSARQTTLVRATEQKVSLSEIASAPSARKCVKARKLRLRLLDDEDLNEARVFVGSKRVKTVRGDALGDAVNLRNLPRSGRYTVRVAVRTVTGRRLAGQRRYRACS